MIYDLFPFPRSFASLWMTLVFVVFLCGCRTEYVPMEVVRMDSVIIASLDRDSVFVRDSIFVREKGDTVYLYKDKYVYVYKNLVDTFFIYRDREVEVPVPVERELSWWERLKMDFGGWLMVLVAAYVVYRMVKWGVKKYREKIRSVGKVFKVG